MQFGHPLGDYSVTCGVGSCMAGVLLRGRVLWEVGVICIHVAGINLGKDPKHRTQRTPLGHSSLWGR